MTEKVDSGRRAIEALVKSEMESPPKVFPYTTRQLANMYGISNSTVFEILRNMGLLAKGRRWFFRHNEPRHE